MKSDGFAGKRILVVEDEYFIATDLQRALQQVGAAVIGPASGLDTGLALVDELLDGALLDVDLNGERAYEIADRLAEQKVPFLFVTGYDGWALPERYRDIPRIEKPFEASSVVSTLEMLIDRAEQ